MNLKKLLALGLSLTMATALLAGCGGTGDDAASGEGGNRLRRAGHHLLQRRRRGHHRHGKRPGQQRL